jgi:hypothetical protein
MNSLTVFDPFMQGRTEYGVRRTIWKKYQRPPVLEHWARRAISRYLDYPVIYFVGLVPTYTRSRTDRLDNIPNLERQTMCLSTR